MSAIRNPYDRVPDAARAFDPADPDAPTLTGTEHIDRLVDRYLRPVMGRDVFLRHTRHPGHLVIRTRPRWHPLSTDADGQPRRRFVHRPWKVEPIRSRRRIVLAWVPANELLPTAITTAYRTVIDRSMLVAGAKGTREVEVHLTNHEAGPVLVIPVLEWPPTICAPHRPGNPHTTQAVIPSDHVGPLILKAEPRARIHPRA